MDLGCHGADRLAALMFSTGPGEPTVSIRVPAGDREAVARLVGAQRHPRPVCATGGVEAAEGTFRVTARRRDDVTFEAPAATDRRLRRACEPGLMLPAVRQDVRAQYTASALRRKATGSILMQGIVGVDGRVREVVLLRRADEDLDRISVEAFSQWVFRPGRYVGRPVPMIVTSEMTFTMR
jgi:hypothetical protein